jgi:AraC family transcriptional regulator of adaptative response/methylated-DNA-[protein]-cysteine methyltransferase
MEGKETESMRPQIADYARIEKAIHFVEENFHRRPSLEEIARIVSLSPYHFQRLFKRWAGVSPKQFVQFLTLEHARKQLTDSRSVLDAAYETGLSSPGRLHDLFVSIEAVSPGEFKSRGAGLKISYGFHATPFGECLLAVTDRGICGLGFVSSGGRARTLTDLRKRWKNATLIGNPHATRPYLNRIFGRNGDGHRKPLTLLLRGTNFQLKVWEALLRIPSGFVTCYEDIAVRLGKPEAVRAVGGAVARNPVAFLIPCHRVIRKIGMFGEYHWGGARKKAMLAWESARAQSAPGGA